MDEVEMILKTMKHFSLLIVFISASLAKRMIMYWGQNGGSLLGNEGEKNLYYYCNSSPFDTIIIGYVTNFQSFYNKDQYPELNLSKHCHSPAIKSYPRLYRCKTIEDAIHLCQRNNKTVQISLLGTSFSRMSYSKQGSVLAERIWDMFLGGFKGPRPFGSAILDGVNLDVKGGVETGYPEFVSKIYELMASDASRSYTISTTPQCVFPYLLLNQTFMEQGQHIDEIYIQYYNNYCHVGSSVFFQTIDEWFTFSNEVEAVHRNRGPKIYVGLIVNKFHRHFQNSRNIVPLYNELQPRDNFGGFMLYDAGYDELNVIGGRKYSSYIKKILDPSYKEKRVKAAIVEKVIYESDKNKRLRKFSPLKKIDSSDSPANNQFSTTTTEAPEIDATVSSGKEKTTFDVPTSTPPTSTSTPLTSTLPTSTPLTSTLSTETSTPLPTTTTTTTVKTTRRTTKKTTTRKRVKRTTTTLGPDIKKDYKVAVQWGQNLASRSTDHLELPLRTYCARRAYDIIIIGQLDIFFDQLNQGNLPALNFANHCKGKFPGIYPTYLRCDEMGRDLEMCQANGKKVLLSLGGGKHWNGFADADEARLFANNLWNLFLGGSHKVRTFGSAVLDGINLDFRVGDGSWFTEFTIELRELMETDETREYMITSTPNCAFPNFRLGKTFEDIGQMFDGIYVNFGDNRCFYGKGADFTKILEDWLTIKSTIFIGLPSAPQVSYNRIHYVPPKKLETLYTDYMQKYPTLGGILLYDASWDDVNLLGGKRYSDYVGELLRPKLYVGKPLLLETNVVVKPKHSYDVVVNWGQNLASRSTEHKEFPLRAYCDRRAYDVVIMNTLDGFFDHQNQGDLPALTFTNHCKGRFPGNYPTYLKCDEIAADILYCQQQRDMKIILSLGGGVKWNGFYDIPKAKQFANTIWNLFLGGKHEMRTFGSAILDGVSIDLRFGEGFWFNAFVKELRDLMDTGGKRKYLLVSTPVCTFPSWRLGKTFKQMGEKFDALYVNFADNSCYFDNRESFDTALTQWLSLKPKILIGLPSSPQASYNARHYVTPKKFETLFSDYVQKNKEIGGVLLDDASWDDVNLINGKRYSDYVGELLRPEAYTAPAPSPKPLSVAPDSAIRIGLSAFVVILSSLFLYINVYFLT